ncbi:MAG: hypothetical protein D6791_10830, partial [Chloroflexi bacterium]
RMNLVSFLLGKLRVAPHRAPLSWRLELPRCYRSLPSNRQSELHLEVESANKNKMDSDTEITKELIPRGFTRSKDGKWYVLFEDE